MSTVYRGQGSGRSLKSHFCSPFLFLTSFSASLSSVVPDLQHQNCQRQTECCSIGHDHGSRPIPIPYTSQHATPKLNSRNMISEISWALLRCQTRTNCGTNETVVQTAAADPIQSTAPRGANSCNTPSPRRSKSLYPCFSFHCF